MNFRKSLVAILIISFLFPGFTVAGNTDFIPLNEGNWWLYKVSYAYIYEGETRSGAYTEKIEILKVAKYKKITVALFSSIPGSFFDEKATLLVIGNKDYYWADEDVFDLVIRKNGKITIEEIEGNITAESSDDKIKWQELSLPLVRNKLFNCGEETKSRGDNYYCDWVRSIKPAKQEYFPGKDEYEIAEYTLPDESHSYYVDGVGLTYYSYSHHGSLDESRWNLQRYFISTKEILKKRTIADLETSVQTPISESKNEVNYSFTNFIGNEPQNPFILKGNSGYSLKFEKGDMDVAYPDNDWRYLEVLKNNTSVLKIDSKEVGVWGYKFSGYDRYDFDGNSYFVVEDWCGGNICGGELVPLIIGKDGLKRGNPIDWPINLYKKGYFFKEGEFYIYFYDEPNNSKPKESKFFKFDKTSGNLIEQKAFKFP